MALRLYDSKPPPEYSYTHAYSAYSAVVQLYARSGQLPTADTLYSRGKIPSPRCRMGCDAIEDQHHIFVECPRYASWRNTTANELVTRTNDKLAEKGIEEIGRKDLLATVKSLFTDNESVWPLQYSVYFLGHIPKFDHKIPSVKDPDENMAAKRLAHHLAAEWHLTSIRLAGRIWGDWQRQMATITDTHKRGR
ncbi:hypothetical protein C8R47DRAFT_766938 [Mycena vitilis]|nr:hypothetical protein C8R47DRAFT_766938 [Mycena vitilis]